MSQKRNLPPWLALLFLIVLSLLLVVASLQRTASEKVSPSLVGKPQLLHQSKNINTPEQQRLKSGIALILDDVGYDMAALRRVLALPEPIAISVIPDAPFARRAAELAHTEGSMVMLHLPMEPASDKYRDKMTTYFLHEKMDRDELRQTFLLGLEKVPYAIGVNNHMGSYLSEQAEPMRHVMELCLEKGLFFVDSITSSSSVAVEMAQEVGVPWASRQIFLDHDRDPLAIEQAWLHAEQCAAQGKRCIVIAHPYRETVAFLEKRLGEKGISLVSVSQLLRGSELTLRKKAEGEL